MTQNLNDRDQFVSDIFWNFHAKIAYRDTTCVDTRTEEVEKIIKLTTQFGFIHYFFLQNTLANQKVMYRKNAN